MPRRITPSPGGFFWLEDADTGHRIGGPYGTYGAANAANLELGDEPQRDQLRRDDAEALKPENRHEGEPNAARP
jgi:hypothetical protein